MVKGIQNLQKKSIVINQTAVSAQKWQLNGTVLFLSIVFKVILNLSGKNCMEITTSEGGIANEMQQTEEQDQHI